jgi:hypothetical protein
MSPKLICSTPRLPNNVPQHHRKASTFEGSCETLATSDVHEFLVQMGKRALPTNID